MLKLLYSLGFRSLYCQPVELLFVYLFIYILIFIISSIIIISSNSSITVVVFYLGSAGRKMYISLMLHLQGYLIVH